MTWPLRPWSYARATGDTSHANRPRPTRLAARFSIHGRLCSIPSHGGLRRWQQPHFGRCRNAGGRLRRPAWQGRPCGHPAVHQLCAARHPQAGRRQHRRAAARALRSHRCHQPARGRGRQELRHRVPAQPAGPMERPVSLHRRRWQRRHPARHLAEFQHLWRNAFAAGPGLCGGLHRRGPHRHDGQLRCRPSGPAGPRLQRLRQDRRGGQIADLHALRAQA